MSFYATFGSVVSALLGYPDGSEVGLEWDEDADSVDILGG